MEHPGATASDRPLPPRRGGRGLSIRARLVLVQALLALGAAGAAGLAGVQATGWMIERRHVDTSVLHAARLMEEMRLPPTRMLLGRLRQILNGEFALLSVPDNRLAATSLPDNLAAAWNGTGPAVSGVVRFGGQAWLAGSAPVKAGGSDRRLVMLVPRQNLAASRREAALWILPAAALAALVALAAGWRLAAGLTGPVTRLAAEMELLAAAAAAGRDAIRTRPATTTASARLPPEIRDLDQAFDILLRELAAHRQQLTRSAQLAAVGRLSAAVVHEIRNPLSGIKMNARVLAEEAAGRPVPELELIQTEVDRLDLYLQDLLALTRDGETPAALAAGPVQLVEVAESVLRLVRPRLRHHNITVECACTAAPPVRGDGRRLRQVMLNLVLNALDAMPQGGQLRLAAAPAAVDHDTVRFTVLDSGPGVALGGQDPFAPFVSGKPQGTGLGLYLSRRMIEAQHGRIGCENPPGGGARFWFELPAMTKPV